MVGWGDLSVGSLCVVIHLCLGFRFFHVFSSMCEEFPQVDCNRHTGRNEEKENVSVMKTKGLERR